MKKDLSSRDDIVQMVDSFYSLIREDVLLGPIFSNVIQNKWPEHLDKMYRFWETVLFDTHSYMGSPFIPHAKLPIDSQHFDRWLQLFSENMKQFEGPKTDEAIERAGKMAQMFVHKLDYLKKHPGIPLK